MVNGADLGVGAREFVDDCGRRVLAPVVDDEHLEIGRQPGGRLDGLDHEARDRPRVVVRREEHGETGRPSGVLLHWERTINRTTGNSRRQGRDDGATTPLTGPGAVPPPGVATASARTRG